MKLPQEKLIDLGIAVVVVVAVVVVAYFIGDKIAGIFGAVLVFLGLRKTPKDKIEQAKENIKKEGEKVEKPKKHDTNSAINKFDDYFDNPH